MGQEELRDDLEAILREPGAERTLHLFVRAGCDRAWLEYYVTNPVEPDERRDDAAARTIDRNLFKIHRQHSGEGGAAGPSIP